MSHSKSKENISTIKRPKQTVYDPSIELVFRNKIKWLHNVLELEWKTSNSKYQLKNHLRGNKSAQSAKRITKQQ